MSDNGQNDKSYPEPPSSGPNPIIVTIGASAGGVSALRRFFDTVPEDTGAAFVVVVHLDPGHRSELPQILAGRTRMPVTQVNEAEKLEADHVYVIPPDRRVQLIDGGIIEWNRGCEELYGYARDEVMGRRKERVLRTQVPGSSFPGLLNKLREEGIWSGELLHHTKDGRTLVVDARLELEALDGRQLVLESTRDITERKEWDERQRVLMRQLHQQKRLVELSRAPIFTWEFDGGILEWNRGCEELYGYTREEAVGRLKEELLKTEVPGLASYQALVNILREEGLWNGELLHHTKDGRVLTVEAAIQVEFVDGRQLALQSVRDITDRKAWEERQRVIYQDLTHRLKNTLTIVQSIAHQTTRSHPTLEDFIAAFDGRLGALGSAHCLLNESSWESADLAELVGKLLAPYAPADSGLCRLEGEPVALDADLVTPFSLVLHELATNAAKYGSLSQPGGTVLIRWSVKSRECGRILEFIWEERGGPAAREPARPGLGSALIDNAIHGATVSREFHPRGLVCTIQVPI